MAFTRNIFLVGPMGAGKSTIGKQLAQQLKMEFFDSDREIESKAGVDIDWIFDVEGEAGFRVRETEMIKELTEKQGIVLATGGGAVVELENRKVLGGRGVVVYLDVSLEQQLERTRRDRRRPLISQADNPEEAIKRLHDERAPIYEELSDYKISTDHGSVRQVAKQIVDLLLSED
ncbi:MAG: shikimate kinase AroK [Gammaproteobacteria bacterium CG22_combo_CG10-13_8_21_14_all_40_8]|nr:MAG: shikimate kinase AroK [Gammaproteobacteria bacterium CG22_combo_CG10-13_8_21_14_all_40_8]